MTVNRYSLDFILGSNVSSPTQSPISNETTPVSPEKKSLSFAFNENFSSDSNRSPAEDQTSSQSLASRSIQHPFTPSQPVPLPLLAPSTHCNQAINPEYDHQLRRAFHQTISNANSNYGGHQARRMRPLYSLFAPKFSDEGNLLIAVSPSKRKEAPSSKKVPKSKIPKTTSVEISSKLEDNSELIKILSQKKLKDDDPIIEENSKKTFGYADDAAFRNGGLLHLLVNSLYKEQDIKKIKVLRSNLQTVREKVRENPEAFLDDELSLSYTLEKRRADDIFRMLATQVLTPEKIKTIFKRMEKYREEKGNNFLHLLVNKLFTNHKSGRCHAYKNYKTIKLLMQDQSPSRINTSLFQLKNEENLNFIEHFDDYFFKTLDTHFRITKLQKLVGKRFFGDNCGEDCTFMFTFENTIEGKHVKGDSILHFLIRKIFKTNDAKQLGIAVKNVTTFVSLVSEYIGNQDVLNLACHKNDENEDFYALFTRLKFECDQNNDPSFRNLKLSLVFLIDKLDELRNQIKRAQTISQENFSLDSDVIIVPNPFQV